MSRLLASSPSWAGALFSLLADAAGVIALLLSVGTIVCHALRGRAAFDVDVIDYADFGASTRFLLAIRNRSYQPLVITSMVYNATLCELEPKMIRGCPDQWNFRATSRFPLCIPPRSASADYIEFLTHSHIPLAPGTTLTLEIHTISGRVRKTLSLGNKSHYLHTRP